MCYYIFISPPSSHIKKRPFIVKYIGMSEQQKLVVLERKGTKDLLIIRISSFEKYYHKLQGDRSIAAMRYFDESNEPEYTTKQLLIALGQDQ